MVRLELDLAKQGVDARHELESLPSEFWSIEGGADEEEKRIKLTLLGIEATKEGLREVSPVLQLVRRMVERVSASPGAPAQVTSADLAEIVGPDRAAELPRLGAVFLDAWQGGSGQWPDGRWEAHGNVFALKFEAISNASEYFAQRSRPWPTGELRDDQVTLLEEIHQVWHDEGAWPEVLPFVLRHDNKGEVLLMLQEVPHRFLRSVPHDLTALKSERLELTLDGVLSVAPDAEPAQLASLLPVLVSHYRDTAGEELISEATIRTSLNISELELTKLRGLVAWEHVFGLRFVEKDGTWSIKVRREILRWNEVSTLKQLIERKQQLEEESSQESKRWELTAFEGSEHSDDDELPDLRNRGLHPVIANAAVNHFERRKFRSAVLDAAIALIDATKKYAKRQDLDGLDLMSNVLSSDESGVLRVNELRTKHDKGEQDGWKFLFMGMVQALRNPPAHKLDELSEIEALEMLAFLSLLCRKLEGMHVDKRRVG